MNIITGYTGEPHITSLQDRAGHQGAYGTGSYVLNVGNKLAATAASANEIRVSDGCLSHQGCLAIIEPGTYDSVEISNGTQGMNRNDLIVARYTKNAETNVESMALVVIQGEPTSGTASDPSYTSGNIQSGATTADMPLYRVALSGVTIDSVTALFSTVRTQAEADALLGDTSISGIGGGTVTGAISTINSSLTISSGTFTFENCRSNGSAIYRIGKIVYFRIDVTATANISPGSAGNGFIQFPSGFRPNAGTAFFGMDASAGTAKQMFVTSGGAASQTPSTIASGNVYRSSGMFIVP